ncbi:hypothetical protein FACS1894208_03430 [Clostridia bacterium]|nr:hypothetical protein FACS1894208_03430 [Clostridia bacterium]
MKKLDNRGAGMITVLVITGMLIALAGALLFGSYIQSTMAHTNKRTDQNFYSLENDIDAKAYGSEIRTMLSEAIAEAYQYALAHWGEHEKAFKDKFESVLIGENIGEDDPPKNITGGRLLNFSEATDTTITKKRDHYTIDNAYYQTHKSDYTDVYVNIRIEIPEFDVGKTPDVERLCEITAEDLIISDGAVFDLTIEGDLWVKNIIVGKGSSLKLKANNIYVADDLELYEDAKVTLECNNYIGYGDDSTNYDITENEDRVEKRSSAILIHVTGSAELDLSGVGNLSLAGNAYVSDMLVGAGAGIDDAIPMGSSISITLEQLLYLADPAYVGGKNPIRLPKDSEIPGKIDIPGGPGGITGAIAKKYPIPGSDDFLVYYLYDFATQAERNAYYHDMFSTKNFNEFFNRYLEKYVPSAQTGSYGLSIIGDFETPGFPASSSLSSLNPKLLDINPNAHTYAYYATKYGYERIDAVTILESSELQPGEEYAWPREPKQTLQIPTGLVGGDTFTVNGKTIVSGGLLAADGNINITGYSTINFVKKDIISDTSAPYNSWDLNDLITIEGWTKNEAPK